MPTESEKSGNNLLKSNALSIVSKISKLNIIYVLGILLIVASFLIGVLYTKVTYLEKNVSGNNSSIAQGLDPQAPQQPTGPIEVSVDDDPVMGDKNAPITMIEFVDYECPFCKRFFDETLPQIKSEYIDTGKVKLVIRDLPLDFHQNAHKESQAAECAREQGGDTAYFKYHDEIFKRTTSNGTGLALDQLSVIANDLGLNGSALQSCLDSEKYKEEVDKDLADASAYGANGTPTFFIGKSNSQGKFQGTILVGAQPFESFKAALDTIQ
ncbi:MAG: DsbA family protein [Candidatus Levybacteria bacterium]|nr:DsbA family protein [Candidatus Levybacteria bacterium]